MIASANLGSLIDFVIMLQAHGLGQQVKKSKHQSQVHVSSQFQHENAEYKIDPNAIEEKFMRFDQKVKSFEDKVMEQGKKLKEQESQINEMERKVCKMDNVSPKAGVFIGFMAFPYENRYYISGDRIVFDNVILNPSNAYNSSSSTFTCPYTGYYFFSVQITSAEDTNSTERIFRRADVQLKIGSSSGIEAITAHSNAGVTQASTSGVYRCELNDHVYVKASIGDQDNKMGVYRSDHSAFTGYLISLDTVDIENSDLNVLLK